METVKIKTAQNIEIDYEVANLGDRILARLLDGLVFAAFVGVIVIPILIIDVNIFRNDTTTITIVCLILGALLFYDLICEIFFNGQSVGKKVLKIKVISLDGGNPTVGQYLLRWAFRLVDFTLTSQLGATICVAASEKKQRIGDLVAGTTLIKTHPKTSINQVAFVPPAEDYEIVFAEAAHLKDSEITLIFEVVRNYKANDNYALLQKTAQKIQDHLNITDRKKMDDITFLGALVKDYNHLQSLENQEAI